MCAWTCGGHGNIVFVQCSLQSAYIDDAVVLRRIKGVAVILTASICTIGNNHIKRVNQPLTRLALGWQGGDVGAVGNVDDSGTGFNKTTVLLVHALRRDAAWHIGLSGLHVSQQDDFAFGIVA